MDAKQFFNIAKLLFFRGKLAQTVVDNTNLIITETAKFPGLNNWHLAYLLATVYHETAGTMEPIREIGRGAKYDYGKKWKYGKGPKRRVAYDTPNQIYYGRGYTQNTWYENYEALTRAAKKSGKDWDFLNNPDLLLTPGPSIWATLYAMVTGLYTGRKFTSYFPDGDATPEEVKEDLINARRVINGLDCAELIAQHAVKFYRALTAEPAK